MDKDRKVIGICTAELDQKFHARMLERVMRELTELGYHVLIFGSDSDMFHMSESDLADAAVFDLMNFELLDVVLIFSETIKQQSIVMHIVKQAAAANIPVISIGEEIEQCYSVIYDTDAAFEELVRHIIEYHNVREVNFISGTKGNKVAENRLAIYKSVLDDYDILYEEERVGYGDFWFEPTRKVMDRFIQPHKVLPEAIICANDSMAVTVCDYLKERKIKVPEDVIVAGIDGIDEGMKHTPGITTCVRDEVRDAKTIAELAKQLSEGEAIQRKTVLEYHMQLSQSCGCQKSHLFDSDALISELNSGLESYRADVRWYAEMSEAFLQCTDEFSFQDIMAEYMPDNSFICINSDLRLEGSREAGKNQGNLLFTEKMNTIVKLEGDIFYCDCYSENIVPESEEDVLHNKPVILLPIHYCKKVIGYMGVWHDLSQKIEMGRTIHFLLNFDHSAGLKLTQ